MIWFVWFISAMMFSLLALIGFMVWTEKNRDWCLILQSRILWSYWVSLLPRWPLRAFCFPGFRDNFCVFSTKRSLLQSQARIDYRSFARPTEANNMKSVGFG